MTFAAQEKWDEFEEYLKDLRNPSTSIERLIKCRNSTSSTILTALVENPNCPDSVLENLSTCAYFEIREQAIRHPNVTPHVLSKVGTYFADLHPSIGSSPKLLPETFTQFAKVNNHTLLNNIASNPQCPPHVLNELAGHYYDIVRQSVAINPNTPEESITESCSEDFSELVLGDLIYRSKNNVHNLEILANNFAIQMNSDLQTKILKLLLQTPKYSEWPEEWIIEHFGF